MISIVVPFFNEEEVLEKFYETLVKGLRSLKLAYEIIFVDDGSSDSSLLIAKKIASKDKDLRLFSFRRNHGKAEALSFGFAKVKGDLVVTLDADLQDRPSEIANLLKKQKEGWDLVSGWRKNRKDSILKIIFSKFFNAVAGFFFGVKLHDYNCGLKLYTRDAAKSVNIYGGMHRFIPLLVAEAGFKVTEIPVVHDLRKLGKSKYSASKLLTQSPDMMTMIFLSKYGKRPLHFFGLIGGVLFGIGVLISFYLTIIHFMGQSIGTRPLLFLGILLILAGIQVGLTGLIADLLLNVSNREGKSLNVPLKYSSEDYTL